jgi:O-antigen/teichoic acid export membrane protein
MRVRRNASHDEHAGEGVAATLGDRRRPERRGGPFGRVVSWALSDETLTKKASLNVLASVLDYGARVAVGLVLNPLLVSRLGDVVFGIYQVLGRLIGVAAPAGGRPSQALKWTIAYRQYSTDYDEKRAQVGSALAVWLLFLPPLAIVAGVLGWFAPLWLGVSTELHLTVRLAAALLVVDLIVTSLVTIPQSVLQGENLGYKRMGISTLLVFVGGVLTAATVLLGAGLVGVAASILAATILTGALFWFLARSYVPWFGIARPSFRAAVAFARLSGWFLLWNLVAQLMRASDVVVLGIAGSTTLVTAYALTRYVPDAIFGLVTIAISGVMPGLGGLVGSRDLQRVVHLRSESMSLTWLIATAFGSAFLLCAEPFLGLWVGAKYYPGGVETFLIVLMVFQFALIRNDASIIDLTLELRAKVLLGLFSAGLSVGLAIALLEALDRKIIGLVLGFIAGRSILTVGYPYVVSRFLGLSLRGQLRAAVRPALSSAVLFAGAVMLAPKVPADSWIVLLAFAGISAVGFSFVSFFVGLSGRQRSRVRKRLSRVVRSA